MDYDHKSKSKPSVFLLVKMTLKSLNGTSWSVYVHSHISYVTLLNSLEPPEILTKISTSKVNVSITKRL